MTKHMRLVVSVLFIVIIVLAVAITRFYSNTGSSTELGGTQPAVEKKLSMDDLGNHIFENDSGLYGIVDSNERVIVYPEWQELFFTDSDLCIASKQIRGRKLFGCIDYEGNIEVPFVYSDIERLKIGERTLYAARAADDLSYVIYDRSFVPCFSRVWDSYKQDENELILTSDNGTYRFSVTGDDLVFRNAAVSSSAMDNPYTLEVTSRVLLSKLSVSTLEKMCGAVDKYLEYAFTGNSDALAEIDAGRSAVFMPLFPDEEPIISKKLSGISDVYVYSTRSDDELLHYAVSITAEISISYKNEEKKTKRLRGSYKALMEFTYSPSEGLKAISGDFIPNKPAYPAPEPEAQQNSVPQVQ